MLTKYVQSNRLNNVFNQSLSFLNIFEKFNQFAKFKQR